MYAIIETGGKQYWVEPGETLRVEKLAAKEGEFVEFSALWAADAGKDGSASRKGTVKAEILRQMQGPKVVVFKKKPKAHYRRTAGHRQELTEIRIKEISSN